MKIYFGFTVAGDRSGIAVARQIVQLLEAAGHEVLTRHLVEENASTADRALGPRAVFERDMQWLDQADIFIGEASGSSFGMGYEAGYVLGATSKRVILFYRREFESRISLLIVGNTHPRCTVVPYSAIGDVEGLLRAL